VETRGGDQTMKQKRKKLTRRWGSDGLNLFSNFLP